MGMLFLGGLFLKYKVYKIDIHGEEKIVLFKPFLFSHHTPYPGF